VENISARVWHGSTLHAEAASFLYGDDMNELILNKPFELQKTGLLVTGKPTIDEWIEAGEKLKLVEGSIQWWLGDWLNYGESAYGEMYSQALDATDYEYGSLRNAKYVANRIEMSRRRDNLSFSHHQEVAPLELNEQNMFLNRAEKEHWSQKDLRNAIKEEKQKDIIALPIGEFRVIYADPPWQYSNTGFDQSASQKYSTMSVEELSEYNLPALGNDKTVIFLWATNPLLPDALTVMQAWQFEYKTNMAWIKNKGPGIGWFQKSRHELLLIGVKPDTLHPSKKFISWFKEDVTKHSKKPDLVYDMIESMYPGPLDETFYVELFARNTRKGWKSWGNEL